MEPPDGATPADALQEPEHVTLTEEVVTVSAVGCVIVVVYVTEHPLESRTKQLYVPTHKPVTEMVEALGVVDQLYV